MFGTAFFWGVSGEYTASFFIIEALFCNDSVAANFVRQIGYTKCCVAVCLSSCKQGRGDISKQATAASCHFLSNSLSTNRGTVPNIVPLPKSVPRDIDAGD
jgi:hypothetical protein